MERELRGPSNSYRDDSGISGALSASKALLDFGDTVIGQSSTLTVRIKNIGNRDVNITDINLVGAPFAHNSAATILPRGERMDVIVTFTAGQTTGTENGSLLRIPAKMNIDSGGT